MNLSNLIILAQTAADGEAASAPGSSSFFQMMLWIFILFGIMWFLMIRPQQREQKRRQAMWDSIRKLDKVVTIGGIHGVVTDIDREQNVLTLRVDEANNVKIRVWTSCVAEVLSEKEDGQS
ncbi:MAG: preprotein translocase subunit YajC [Planctomycetia bacterium]|nr:preprotein translocase subunit YajC [Planctomycetia bacterium]